MYKDHINFIGKLKYKVSNEYHGKIINLMISGSHLFGFESPDSDTDYRGCFQVKTNKLLTTRKIKDTIEFKTMKEGMTKENQHEFDVYDKDAVLDELGKEINLLLDGNCNHYEHLFADQLIKTPEFMELKRFFSENINLTGLYNSYRGMAYQNYKKFILGGKHTVKKYLYVLRGLMAGTYCLAYKQIQPNMEILTQRFHSPVAKELIDLKKRGMEKDPVKKNLDKYNREVDRWFLIIDGLAEEILPPYDHRKKEKIRDDSDKLLHKLRISYLDL